jgi:hypothetical protein
MDQEEALGPPPGKLGELSVKWQLGQVYSAKRKEYNMVWEGKIATEDIPIFLKQEEQRANSAFNIKDKQDNTSAGPPAQVRCDSVKWKTACECKCV